MTSIRDRARRIARIRKVKRDWARSFLFRNHLTASHEFQLLDVLRDIRMLLLCVVVMLAFNQCRGPDMVVHIDDMERGQ